MFVPGVSGDHGVPRWIGAPAITDHQSRSRTHRLWRLIRLRAVRRQRIGWTGNRRRFCGNGSRHGFRRQWQWQWRLFRRKRYLRWNSRWRIRSHFHYHPRVRASAKSAGRNRKCPAAAKCDHELLNGAVRRRPSFSSTRTSGITPAPRY